MHNGVEKASAMNLNSSTALVTGGAVRIGRAIAEALAARGCSVVVHYHRSAAEAKGLCRDLAGRGRRAVAVRGDLGSPAGCERVIREARRQAGPLNILVNNAAVFHKDTIASTTEAKLLSELRVNFVAPVMLTRAFARQCRGSRSGSRIHG